jgi:SAM-dependent methyltransferase
MKGRGSAGKRRRELYRRKVEALAVGEGWDDRSVGSVLDFGCGTGWFVSFLCERGARVIGVEVRKEALTQGRQGCLDYGSLLVWYGGEVLPVRSVSVDMILGVGVLRSLMDRGPLEDALDEWKRCLKPGGALVLVETDNRALRQYMTVADLRVTLSGFGFECIRWYPIRKVSWWGLRLVKLGIVPEIGYGLLARWELWWRRRKPWVLGKHAYFGEFRKSSG